MTFPPATSIANTTIVAYGGKAIRLFRDAAKRHPHAEVSANLVRVVDELLASRPNIAPATFRQRKAAILWSLARLKEGAPDRGNPDVLAAMARLRMATSAGCKKKTTETSAKKVKKILASDFDAICRTLAGNLDLAERAKPTLAAITLLNLTGMRPVELLSVELSEIEDGRICVEVSSAKATNGRGIGAKRHIVLDVLPAEERALVEYWPIYVAERQAMKIPGTLSNLKAYLRRTAERALGKRRAYPCFYTFRHQVAADMKSAGRTPEEIAAVLGHGSSRTATTHYARKVSGRGRVRVSPDSALVAQVRMTATKFPGARCKAPALR